ncbi:protein DpdE [Streptomyces variegatus]|uniref:protein DpdE n=1 Tax=Streptomyces variegatus TaxID=284040 RepID=UPI003C30E410
MFHEKRERAELLNRFSPSTKYVGRWVQVRSNNLGFGFCRGKHPEGAVVAYTDIPGLPQTVNVVAVEDLQLPRVSSGTRVWVKGQPYGWHAAEIVGWAGLDEYRIRVAGMYREVKLRGDQFVIRWDKPLTDPVSAVAQGFCDTPEYYEARRAFLDQLVDQRRVSRGFTAVLSAPVELYQHQLDTVARVLSDPVLRFVLADEVGLGKTVEAGLVLRQLLLDDGAATALVAVPAALRHQWDEELRGRLLLDDALNGRRLRLVTHEDLIDEVGLHKHVLVVVDEAHRLLPHLERPPGLRRDLLSTRGLLLLSATPMSGNLSTLLELLHLVDPVAFPRTDLDSFRDRVQQREGEATSLQVLSSRRASLRQRENVLQELLLLHSADPILVGLVAQCRATGDIASPAWSALVTYVRETYRISRRMIRNRRNSATTEEYPVAGRHAVFVSLADPARAVVDEFLEQYRDHLMGQSASSAYARTVMRGLGGPRSLLRHLKQRLAATAGTSHAVPSHDRALFESAVARLQLADTSTRLERALNVVQDRLDHDLKIVVVGTSRDTAQEFLEAARARWGASVGEHLNHTEQQTREDDVLTFLEAAGGRVLVGDHSLEEGRNLQEAHVLVNLDLPLDPNRLEQRIGRLDRFARRTQSAEVVIFTEPDSEWVTAHIRLLSEGVGIFHNSVATLQRKLADLLQDLVARLQREGSRAFAVDLAALQISLDEERNDIDLLEELESVTMASDFDDASVSDLRAAEEKAEPLRAAFSRFASASGGLGLRHQEDPVEHLLRFRTDPGQRIYGLPDDASRQVLPLLKRPRAYARNTATHHTGVAPLRLGDPLVEWLERYLRADERGRSRAIVRPHTGGREPVLWLSCDFLVEFDAAQLQAETEGIRRRLRRRGDALLPPTVVRTWTDPAGPAPAALQEDMLEPPFDKTSDQVLRGHLWKDVLAALPDWQELCRLSAEAALRHIEATPILTSEPATASARGRAEVAARLAVLQSRSQRLPSEGERISAAQELQREETLGQALVRGIEHPAVSIIACGAVVLWPTS